jgi:hypothetical protein
MKIVFCRFNWRLLAALPALLLNPRIGPAQIVPIPTVTIQATDPIAKESGKPATFTLFRAGPTNYALNVYYQIGGTASNGVDYQMISSFTLIPAGATSASITIKPLIDTNAEGTLTVVLTLTNSPLLSPLIPVNYRIGTPSRAVAYIFDDDEGSNLPPVVSIFSPSGGDVFHGPTNIQILAKAFDPDGSVTNVEFYANNKDLGPGLMVVLDPPGVNGITGPIYLFNWQNVQIGDYALTAVATDNDGASTTSAPVNIAVVGPPPFVKITSPSNGTIFTAPVDIPISAQAISAGPDIVRVNFLADDHFIGTDAGTNKPEYDMVWSNAPTGFYSLRAEAIDQFGGVGFSAPVFIAVVGTNRPPTNPPVVTIYARDPIAVVGTNCLGCYTNPTAAALNFRAITNTATFVVRRCGETNDDLLVYYSTSGTASNGEDYAPLPGSVTIPAGQRAALIVVDPLVESVPECPETVILTLQQPTNTPPSYIVGWPGKAAAVIVDCDFLPPASSVLCTGPFHYFCPPPTASGSPYYRLECSLDMIHWLPICTNTASAIGIHFTDPDSACFPSQYYRVITQSTAPADYP